jgi:hypothetical protein
LNFPSALAKGVSGTVRCLSRYIPAELTAGGGEAGIDGPRNDGNIGKYPSASEVQLYDSSLNSFEIQ